LNNKGQTCYKLNHQSNTTEPERTALKHLSSLKNITIKPADKGGALVVMNTIDYNNEALRQLSDPVYYTKLNTLIYPLIIPRLIALLQKLYLCHAISAKQLAYFTPVLNEVRPRIFYLLPKIHKPINTWPNPSMPAGRPIVSDCSSDTYRISEYLDSFLTPISILHKSYIRDTYDFVHKLTQLTIPPDAILFTGDVTSLYTNMLLDRTLDVVRLAFNRHPKPDRPDSLLLDLLDLTLKNNDFTFNGSFFLQTRGIAMGKKYAPALANLYLIEFDELASSTNLPVTPLCFYRYLDDVFGVWPGTLEQLRNYNTYLNSLIHGLTITLQSHTNHIDFLDVTIFKSTFNNHTHLLTKVFFKDTASHQLLHTDSFHPPATALGVAKSQILRYKRLSSLSYDFNNTCQYIFKILVKRGYKIRDLKRIKSSITHPYRRPQLVIPPPPLTPPPPPTKKLIPIVLPYNKLSNALITRWRKKINLHDWFTNHRVVGAFTNNKNLRKNLVHSK
jgi:hypothetical protein